LGLEGGGGYKAAASEEKSFNFGKYEGEKSNGGGGEKVRVWNKLLSQDVMAAEGSSWWKMGEKPFIYKVREKKKKKKGGAHLLKRGATSGKGKGSLGKKGRKTNNEKRERAGKQKKGKSSAR